MAVLAIGPMTFMTLVAPATSQHSGQTATTRSRAPGPEVQRAAERGISTQHDGRETVFEVDLVGHDFGNVAGERGVTLPVTDIATGWTENRSVRNTARNGC